MGKVYECIGRKANKPFFLEKICCNIFSAEELVYCIYENAELLEKDIFTTELANWLEDECETVRIADRMYQLISRDAEAAEYAQVLLEEFPFVSSGQRARFLELLGTENNENGPARRKRRGDYFLQKRRYVHALNEYEAVLAETPLEDVKMRAETYHNMGMARAGLFLLEQAQQDFLKAYETDGKEEHYYYYAATMRFSMTDSEYIRTISDDVQMREITLKLEANMQEAAGKWEAGPGVELEEKRQKLKAAGETEYAEWVNKTLSEAKEEYRKCIQ